MKEAFMLEQPDEGPFLYIFSGLPGTGKSSLAQRLARRLVCTYLRIDTLEHGLHELLSVTVEGEGYRLAYRLAGDTLRLGGSVVADSCNPLELTRREWEQVAKDAGARFINIEIICSDTLEHRHRVESRPSDIPGMTLPTWDEVTQRWYELWTVERLVVDTAGLEVEESAEELFSRLRERGARLCEGRKTVN